jgi:hypothetical protein
VHFVELQSSATQFLAEESHIISQTQAVSDGISMRCLHMLEPILQMITIEPTRSYHPSGAQTAHLCVLSQSCCREYYLSCVSHSSQPSHSRDQRNEIRRKWRRNGKLTKHWPPTRPTQQQPSPFVPPPTSPY